MPKKVLFLSPCSFLHCTVCNCSFNTHFCLWHYLTYHPQKQNSINSTIEIAVWNFWKCLWWEFKCCSTRDNMEVFWLFWQGEEEFLSSQRLHVAPASFTSVCKIRWLGATMAPVLPCLGPLRSDNTPWKGLIEVLVSEREMGLFMLGLSLSLVSCQAGKHCSIKLLLKSQ